MSRDFQRLELSGAKGDSYSPHETKHRAGNKSRFFAEPETTVKEHTIPSKNRTKMWAANKSSTEEKTQPHPAHI